jgi:hypothetical protein
MRFGNKERVLYFIGYLLHDSLKPEKQNEQQI